MGGYEEILEEIRRVYGFLSAVFGLITDAEERNVGPVFSLQILATHIVVVNTVEAASELLETRSSVYSQRIPTTMPKL